MRSRAAARCGLLCFTGVLSSSCEKSDSLVDADLAEGMTAIHSAMRAVFNLTKEKGMEGIIAKSLVGKTAAKISSLE
jgi:hypothetical protein